MDFATIKQRMEAQLVELNELCKEVGDHIMGSEEFKTLPVLHAQAVIEQMAHMHMFREMLVQRLSVLNLAPPAAQEPA